MPDDYRDVDGHADRVRVRRDVAARADNGDQYGPGPTPAPGHDRLGVQGVLLGRRVELAQHAAACPCGPRGRIDLDAAQASQV
jgi:hypothetical protein